MALRESDKAAGIFLVWVAVSAAYLHIFGLGRLGELTQAAGFEAAAWLRTCFYVAAGVCMMSLAGALSVKPRPALTVSFLVGALAVLAGGAGSYIASHQVPPPPLPAVSLLLSITAALTWPFFVRTRRGLRAEADEGGRDACSHAA